MLEHGGHLIDAAKKYNIPHNQWIDLSTGINPNGWKIPTIPAECWQRLPEANDGLIDAAKQYYQCSTVLPVAGSQAAIQTLPLLRNKSRVGVLSPAYAEHTYSWKNAGHEVVELQADKINTQVKNLDVLIVVNPNNPTGQCFDKEQLLAWHKVLKQRNGWLIIDEAFIDTTPEQSLSGYPAQDGLIILRSIGKFFGLAGIRCGFVIATSPVLEKLNEKLGPWAISHPARYIATVALLDTVWQHTTKYELKQNTEQLDLLLTKHQLKADGKTDLFIWIKTSIAESIHHKLAQQGILTRLFLQPQSLRFGLPQSTKQYNDLSMALTKILTH